MKNLKRLIALVAVFALALTTIASAATFTDVAEDSAYYEAVETLTKLGIVDGMPDGTYQPEKVVTRAEMAKLIATMQGIGNTAQSGSATKFSDVPASHWASGYIANATGVAINGMPDGTFRPDQNVKFEEAVKMIMATLGYTVVANGNGGYPMGFVSAAIKEGVTNNVANANVGTDANRGTIAQLIYNAIDTPLVEQVTWEADGSGEYTKYDGTGSKAYKTLMSENLDVVKMKGVVLANSVMSVNEAVTIDKDDDATVEITVNYGYKVVDNDFFDKDGDSNYPNGYTFLAGDSDAADYVGKAVIYFAMENDYDEWEIISISEDSTYNKSVTFSLADYDADESGAREIYYFKDGASKSTKLSIQAGAVGLYNNAYYAMETTETTGEGDDAETTTYNYNTLIAALAAGNYGGQVTVIDTDKTTGYDMIIVEAAVSAVVDEISGTKIVLKEAITLPRGGSINKVETDADDSVVVITKDGEVIDIDEVGEDDILSIVAANKNAAYYVVDVMSNIVEGTVSSKKNSTTSDDGKAYKIDGTWYDVAAGADIGTVNAGDAGKFYIDKYGKIAYYDETVGAAGNYAYIIDTLVMTDDWGNLTAEIKMVTSEGVKTYSTTEKFAVDSSDYDLGDDELEADALDGLNGNVVDITMSNGSVKKVITVDYSDDDEFEVAVASVTGKYDAEAYEIGSTELEADTVVFYIDATTPSNSYVGSLADMEDAIQISGVHNAKLYTDDDSLSTDGNILVIEGLATTISASTGLAVIVDFEDATNEDEEDIYAITVLYNGDEVTLTTSADVATNIYSGMTIGDIVKIKVNGNNVITALKKVFNFAEDVRDNYETLTISGLFNSTDFGTLGTNPGEDTEYFDGGYAIAYSKSGKKVTIADGRAYKLSACDNVYVIDNTGRKISIEVGSAGDFVYDEKIYEDGVVITDKSNNEIDATDVADIVIFRMYDGEPVEAVIIKGAEDYDWDIPVD